MSRRRRWARRILVLSAVGVACWLLSSYVAAYRLTHRRHPRFAEPAPRVDWGVVEEHRFRTRDGESIGAWYVDAAGESPAVVLLHGHGGSRRNSLGTAETLARAGIPTLMISMRAHGDSTGDFNDVGLGARGDVVAAVEFLERRRPGRPIVLMGISMGSAAAIFAAAELGDRVHGYILEAPYRNLRVAVRNRTRAYLPMPLDWVAFQGLQVMAPLMIGDVDAIAPERAIGGIPAAVPVLILAGDGDPLARPEEARLLFESVRDHARLEFFRSDGHRPLAPSDPGRYRDLLLAFLRGR